MIDLLSLPASSCPRPVNLKIAALGCSDVMTYVWCYSKGLICIFLTLTHTDAQANIHSRLATHSLDASSGKERHTQRDREGSDIFKSFSNFQATKGLLFLIRWAFNQPIIV